MFYASSRRDATRCDAARHSTARQRARRDLESRQRTREMAITKEFNVPVDRCAWFEARANVEGWLKRRRCVAGCRNDAVESSACAVARDGDAALERVDNDERYICSCFHARETDV